MTTREIFAIAEIERHNQGKTLSTVAREAGFGSSSHMYKWKFGQVWASIELMDRVLHVLGLELTVRRIPEEESHGNEP